MDGPKGHSNPLWAQNELAAHLCRVHSSSLLTLRRVQSRRFPDTCIFPRFWSFSVIFRRGNFLLYAFLLDRFQIRETTFLKFRGYFIVRRIFLEICRTRTSRHSRKNAYIVNYPRSQKFRRGKLPPARTFLDKKIAFEDFSTIHEISSNGEL